MRVGREECDKANIFVIYANRYRCNRYLCMHVVPIEGRINANSLRTKLKLNQNQKQKQKEQQQQKQTLT